MTKWHRTRRGDLGLRTSGLGALALSYASLHHLMQLHDAHPVHWTPGVVAYVLTTIGFLGGSAGTALTLLGAHLFDEVQVSERWRVRPPTDRRMEVAVSAHVWSVADTMSGNDPSPLAAWRADRLPTRHVRRSGLLKVEPPTFLLD